MVKSFNQRWVISFENPSIIAIRRFGHQCICENCYGICFKAADNAQSMHATSNVEMLKSAVRRIEKFCLTDLVLRL